MASSDAVRRVEWLGPFAWLADATESVFDTAAGWERGVYLMTVPWNEGFLICVVGHTARSFRQRFWEHTKDYVAGTYNLLDATAVLRGERDLIWQGLWYGQNAHRRLPELLARGAEHFSQVQALLSAFRVFLAPVPRDARLPERMEAAIMEKLYEAPRPMSSIPDQGMHLVPRRADESPILVRMSCPERLHGLPPELEV